MKKIIALLLVITTTVAVSIGATLAYLTDRDSEANVFTVGDVSIDLNEDFNQGSTLIPGVGIEKEPTITNTGKNDAWVWATVAIPGSLDEVVELLNQNTTEWDWSTVAAVENVTINNATYTVLTALYNEKLAKDAETPALFTGVALDTTVDIDPDGQWHIVENGVAKDLDWNNSNGNPVIYVSAYAMQTEGFADQNSDGVIDVKDAYVAYNAQWAANGTEYAAAPVMVATAEDMAAAIAEGKSVALTADVTVDGSNMVTVPKGADVTVDLNGHNITADFSAKTDGSSAIFTIDKNASLTVNGEGKVHATAAPTTSYVSSIFTNLGTLVVNGGEYTMTYGTYAEGYLIPTIIDTNSNIGKATTTINGGTFTHTRNMFRNFAQPKRGENNATLIINGGTFKGEANDYASIWNQKTSGAGVEGDGIVIVNGGNFEYVEVTNDFETGVTIAKGVNLKIAE